MAASSWYRIVVLLAVPWVAFAETDDGFESVTDGSEETLPGVVRWTDANGEVHYTNDPGGVPKGVNAKPVRAGRVSEISHHPPRASTPPALAVTSDAPPPSPAAQRAGSELPDPDETYWRGRFRDAYQAIATLEATLAADRQLARELEPFGLYNGRCAVGAGPYYSGQGPVYGGPGFCGAGWNDLVSVRTRIRQTEVALTRAKDDLDALERQASFRAVPREWRR